MDSTQPRPFDDPVSVNKKEFSEQGKIRWHWVKRKKIVEKKLPGICPLLILLSSRIGEKGREGEYFAAIYYAGETRRPTGPFTTRLGSLMIWPRDNEFLFSFIFFFLFDV